MVFTQDDASDAVAAVALSTNREPEVFTVARGDVIHKLIMVCADISSTGEVGACYVYSVRTGRVYPVSAVEDPADVFPVIFKRDSAH